MSMIRENEKRRNEGLEIETKDELDNMSHGKLDVNKGVNFKVKGKANENFKIKEENQGRTQQKDHYYPPQDEKYLT
jgi:hypothetical protein